MSARRSTRWRTVTGLVVVASLLAACGTDDEDSSASREDGLTSITIGMAPFAGTAGIPIAIDQGFFEEEGLDVELNTTIENPAIPSAVISGDLEVGMSAYPAVAAYATQDLPIKIAVGLSRNGDGTGSDDVGLQMVTLADGGLSSPSELEGKVVLVNSLGTDPEATARSIAIDAGVDPDSLKLQPVSPSEMGAALKAGRADAAVISEPFATILKQQEDVTVLGDNLALQPNRPQLNLIVSDEYAEKNPDIVEAIQRAVAKGNQYATENPDAVREVLVDEYEFAPEVAEAMPLPQFEPFPDEATVQEVAVTLTDLGLLPEAPDMGALMLSAPSGVS